MYRKDARRDFTSPENETAEIQDPTIAPDSQRTSETERSSLLPVPTKSPRLYSTLYSNSACVYGFPLIMGIGLITNTLSFMVIVMSDIRDTSIGVYLCVLAWADSLCLVMLTSIYWGIPVLRGQFPGLHVYKLQRFAHPICIGVAAMCVVCVTTDRMIAVWFPLKAKQATTRTRALTVTCTIIGLLICVYFPRLFVSKGTCVGTNSPLCSYIRFSEIFVNVLYAYGTIPYLFCMNIAIAVKLLRPGEVVVETTVGGRSKAGVKVAKTVLAVSVAYLVCATPSNVLATMISLNIQPFNDPLTAEITFTTCRLLLVSNHCINFFLYVLTSSRFRGTLLGLCGISTLRRNHHATTASCTSRSQSSAVSQGSGTGSVA